MRHGEDGYRAARTCATCCYGFVDKIGSRAFGYRCSVHGDSRCNKRNVCDLHMTDYEEEELCRSNS